MNEEIDDVINSNLHMSDSSVYKVTSIEQIKDMIDCGYVRAKYYIVRGERVDGNIYWSHGNGELCYFDKSPIIESSVDKVKNGQKGAVSINDLTAIWIFDNEQNKYINKLNEIKKLCNQRFHERYDNKKLTIDEMEQFFKESGYQCIGHGTGRSGDAVETVLSIFKNGLRTKDNSLSFTSIPISTPTKELIQNYRELGIDIPTMDSLKELLNNWKHLNSRKIIIARLPIAYINRKGDRDDLDGEMYGAFMNEIKKENGDIKYYLDSRFILGYYDADIQKFIINNKYERALTDETINKLQVGYLKALKKTKARLKKAREIFPFANRVKKIDDIVDSREYDFDISNFDDDNILWDTLDNNDSIKL